MTLAELEAIPWYVEMAAGTNVGEYAIFGGGKHGNTMHGATFAIRHHGENINIHVFPGTKYKFSGMGTEQTSGSYQKVNVTLPGYVKYKKGTV